MLKQLQIKSDLDEKRAVLADCENALEELKSRKSALEEQIRTADAEGLASLTKELEKLESDWDAAEKRKSITAAELADLEKLLLEAEKSAVNMREVNKDMETRSYNIEEMRSFGETLKQARSGVNEGKVLIPTTILDVLRSETEKASKLYGYVNVKQTKGEARQPVLGKAPVAVWSEMNNGSTNEVELTVSKVEVDGYLVSAYISVPKDLLKDAEADLAAEVVSLLGSALGQALDKAIIAGEGATAKQPEGITTTEGVVKATVNGTGLDLFKGIVEAAGSLKDYNGGSAFWAMNRKTYAKVQAEALNFNSAAAIAAGFDKTLPIVGGDIVKLDCVADNQIVGGYGSAYLLAEREGASVSRSDEVKFIDRSSVFLGEARYDGKVVFPDSFAVITIGGAE